MRIPPKSFLGSQFFRLGFLGLGLLGFQFGAFEFNRLGSRRRDGSNGWFIPGLQRQPLTVIDGGFTGTLMFDQAGANPGGGGRIVERTCDQSELHAKAVIAFPDHHDRLQGLQRRIRPDFQ